MQRAWILVLLATVFVGHLGSARGDSLVAAAGVEAGVSSWNNDRVASTTLKVGYQWQQLSAYFLTEAGLADVDTRTLQHVELGAEYRLPVRTSFAFVRAGLTHRHEIPMDSVKADISSLLGYGDGIRHRAGGSAGVGWLIPFARTSNQLWYVAIEANSDLLFGAAGPRTYWGFGAGLGVTYDWNAPKT